MRAVFWAFLFIIGGFFLNQIGIEHNAWYAFFGYFVGVGHASHVWSEI